MKRILLIATILVTVVPHMALGQSSLLANAGKAGLYVKSLEEVLRLPDSEMDLATATLIASEYWSDMVAGRRYLEQLDAMAMEIFGVGHHDHALPELGADHLVLVVAV